MARVPRLVLAIACVTVALSGCRSEKTSDDGAGPSSFTGRARVTGTITSLEAASAATDDLLAPFTLTVAETGRGGLTIPRALVGGDEQSIAWTGGRPLPVTGSCRLIAGETSVEVEGVTARLALDGAPRAMSGTDCALGSSVAVGNGGLSRAMETVTFAAPGEAVFRTTGGVSVTVPALRRFEGRSGKLTIKGDFIVEREGFKAAKAERLEQSRGTWVAEIKGGADPGTLRVVATLEGALRRS